MKSLKCHFLLIVAGFFLFAGCSSSTNNQLNKSGIPIIFETDMGNDIDDALALDMLYKYADMGLVHLLGVSTNKESPYSIKFIDLMNTWYGYPNLPMGKITKGVDYENDASNYAKRTFLYEEGGKSPFKRTHTDYEKIPEAPLFYRELLAQQPDHSVVLISVGFSTNIARLLDTQPDQFSSLTGKELVAQKVKYLSMMAGHAADSTFREYNVKLDIPAAQKVFREWPTPIVISPFEVGLAILFPATVIENNLAYATPHPLKIAYENYLPMPYDRPTWDLTSVLYAVEGAGNYFDVSEKGRMEADDKGRTRFYPDENGKHVYMSVSNEQTEIVKNRFIELVSMKPKNKGQTHERASFTPGRIWNDTNGNPINAHGGGVIHVDGVYFWHGEHKLPGRSEKEGAGGGVRCYSSTDLYNWKDEGIVLSVDYRNEESDIAAGCILERPKVIYNEPTGTYVMYFKLYPKGTGYDTGYVGVATSISPNGPFTYRHKFLGADSPKGSGDFCMYRAKDGFVYHFTVRKPDKAFCYGQLRNDYLFPEGNYRVMEEVTSHTEAPAIVHTLGKYYMLGSGSTGWAPNTARSFSSKTLTEGYEDYGNPCVGVNPNNQLGPEKTFGGQISFILPVENRQDCYIAMFDIWNPDLAADGLYVWLPLTFREGKPVVEWHDEWDLSVFDIQN